MRGQGESHGLLQHFTSEELDESKHIDLSDLARPTHVTPRTQKTARRRRSWCLIVAVVTTTVLTWVSVAFLSRHWSPAVSHGPAADQLAIQLHPEEHTTRPPTTLVFNWTVTSGLRAPDGVQKRVYMVNDQFPGPTIEARSGDRIVIHVHNGLADEGISLHWHGLRLADHNDMDGAVGLTQCPIPAGGDFVYDFAIGAEEHGTFWWHGHDRTHRADGLFGGLVVHAPEMAAAAKTADEDALLMIGDWFHQQQTEVFDWYEDYSHMGSEPVPDSLLVNGRGRYNCSMAVPARPVVCDQIALQAMVPLLASTGRGQSRLRVVNTGTIAGLSMSIDGAVLRVIQVDGGFDVRSEAKETVGILYPGERIDVIVEWKERMPAAPWLRIYLDEENFGYGNMALSPNQLFPLLPSTPGFADAESARATALGDKADVLDLATLTASTRASDTLPAQAQQTILLYAKTQILSHFDYKPMGSINHTSWAPQAPPLLALNRTSWDANQLVPFVIGTAADPSRSPAVRVDLVINNLDDGAHPFHLHGNSFYVLSSYRSPGRAGWGSYNPYTDGEPPSGLNRDAPLRKDTVSVPRRGHVVLSFVADNPGLWMLHCHMLVHMSSGMAMALHVGDAGDYDHVAAVDESAARLCPAE